MHTLIMDGGKRPRRKRAPGGAERKMTMATTNTTTQYRIGSDTYDVTISDSGRVVVTGYEGRLCGQLTDDGVAWSRATRGRYSEEMRQTLAGHIMATRRDAEPSEPCIVAHDGFSELYACECGRTVDAATEDMGHDWDGTCPECDELMGMFARG